LDHFKNQLDKIEKSCEKIHEEIEEINITLALNTQSLKEHMRRTEINEKAISLVIEKALPPIKASIDKVTFAVRVVPWVLGIAAAIVAIVNKSGISLF